MFKKSKSILNQKGFSLGEILIVLVIIGGIMAIVLPKIADGNAKGKVNNTKMKMSEVENKINEYNSECSKYPKSIEFITNDDPDCKQWAANPKMKHLLKDGWGQDFLYEANSTGYNLKSLGADKKEGGSGYDKDIFSEGSTGAQE
jgi:general secretion pathway protein G